MPFQQLCVIGRDDALRNLHGDEQWGGTNCYADYAGIARKYKPKMILELGVYLGYSACAMLFGSKEGRSAAANLDASPVDYVGIDLELEERDSNVIAKDNIRRLHKWANIHIAKYDTNSKDADYFLAHFLVHLQQDYHLSANDLLFDMVHVDSDHSVIGTMNAMLLGFAFLADGGVMIVDDAKIPSVADGIKHCLWESKEIFRCNSQFYKEHSRDGWCLFQKKGSISL